MYISLHNPNGTFKNCGAGIPVCVTDGIGRGAGACSFGQGFTGAAGPII
jgi:hypothetical protein